MKIDFGKYVGIPWMFNGSSRAGCDCVGLLRLFYKEQGWEPSFDDGKPVDEEWYLKSPYRLVRYLGKHFNKVTEKNLLSPGDVIYFRENGEGHVGIWCGYGKVLQTYPPKHSMLYTASHIVRFDKIKQLYICGFKRRVADAVIGT